MDNVLFKKALPHFTAVLLFLILPAIYFSPQLEGKKLNQHDTNTATGMAKEITDYNKTHSDLALWTNSMFGGMPAYLIGLPTYSFISPIYSLTTLFDWRPISFVFLYLIGFYLALLLFGINPWISLIGAIAFGFSSYDFIIIAAGHNTKAIAIGYMAPLIGALYHAWKKNLWVGSAFFALFLALQIYANHLQITYYTMLTILIFGIVETYFAFREKQVTDFLKKSGVIALFALMAIAANAERLWTTYEYGKFSLRGPSELTDDKGNKTSGLDKDYATDWSYGIDETMTLLIPNFKGGASVIDFGENSTTAELLRNNNVPNANSIVKQLPGYWGTQPGTSGPVYAGAIVLFLFVLSLFLTKGSIRIWIISATIFSILLSWGRNFMPLTDLFLDYFPGYNKFRTVSMILVIASFAIPLLASIGLYKIFSEEIDRVQWKKALTWSVALTAGISFLFFLLPGLSGSFVSASDAQMHLPDWLQSGLIADRKAFLRADAIRSALLILAAALVLWAYVAKKLKPNYALAIIGCLILFDMWGVDKRYLNNDNFVQEQKARNPYPMTKADKEILKDKNEFRVLNLTVDPFNEASTSYYHQSIGGYHGAKMRRYQELIDFRIGKEIRQLGTKLNTLKADARVDSVFIGLNALNMMNTKYLIYNPEAAPIVNPKALGSAWLVRSYQLADNADQEIAALDKIDPGKEIVVNKKFQSLLESVTPGTDVTSKLALKSYSPNQLVYSYSGKGKEIAVFSEIYYPKGWNAYIGDQLIPYFQANYVLRAMVLPEGTYDITFKFEPLSYRLGKQISMVSSLLLLLFIGFVLYKNITLKNSSK
ncbi:MAG: YfhO family protein [Bacteroidetes bacterium]|nr:YfhO family protein [Bacteroidota bacterium]